MPADESTRLRIRQYLIELMDEQAADAMMESMPPIPWTELATKADLAQLDRRFDGVDGRIDTLTLRVDQTSSDLQELTRTVATQGASLGARMDNISERLGARMDSVSERMDSIGTRMDDLGVQLGQLGRAVTFGAATVAVTLAVFIIGTIASLIASGAFG
jgi:methyl-accepting chemotaxis protein